MFELTLKTGGAAFCNPDTGEKDPMCEAAEVERILKTVAEQVYHLGARSGIIMDINGNNVGKWIFSD